MRLLKAFFMVVLVMAKLNAHADDNIKQPGLAGSWYPSDPKELSRMVDGFLFQVPESILTQEAGVIISPHAGYVFSGPTAAYGFKAVKHQKIKTVIVLAPTHHYSFKGASVWAKGAFLTPLGAAQVDENLAAKLIAQDKIFSFRKDVFEGVAGRAENSVETQIPFIQRAFPEAKIVPVILGFPLSPNDAQAIAMALVDAVGNQNDVLVDVSVDQSHFHALKEANAIDAKGLAAIETFDVESFWNGHLNRSMEVDGFHVVAVAMIYAKARGFTRVSRLKYATSFDATKDASSVVGYASLAFIKGQNQGVLPLSEVEKKRLMTLARQTLDAFVATGQVPDLKVDDARLAEEEGAFVTLKKNGQLRGCIGNIIGDGPLYKTVRDMAVAAASQDPRFPPVNPDELKAIDLEISVLSKPRVVKSADEIVMGTHGVIVRRGPRGGVFLPQVATETGWDKERFMSELCSQKAGLPPDCWKDPSTRLEIFTADVFGERE